MERAGANRRKKASLEGPTALLALTIYGGWIAITFFWASLPWPLLVALGAWLVAWQLSLQHEALHGHPTRSRRINDAIAFPPLSLWLPYQLYRTTHLHHHNDDRLTDPIEHP